MRSRVLFLILLAAILECPLTVSAQQRGDTLRVVLPAGTPIVPGPTGDVLVYIQRPAGFMEMVGCAPDTTPRPVQNVLVIDRVGLVGRPFQTTVVTISDNGEAQTTPVRNGTRVGNLTFIGGGSPSCSTLNGQFDKYNTVE